MNTRTITIGIAVIILAGLAYYIGINREPATTDETQQQQQVTQTDPKATETSEQVVGAWKSDDDPKYTREFRADGTVTDRYEGEASATATGTWAVFTAKTELPAGITFQLNHDDAYIRVVMDGEAYNYRVEKATSAELELIYMDRGGVLRFSKVN